MNISIEPFLVTGDVTLRQAMERLEATEERIVFVTDAERGLIGALTDGDVRRWILADGSLNEEVRSVCNPDPYTAGPGYRLDEIRALMLDRNIACVPVLDAERRVIDLLFWSRVFRDQPERPAPAPLGVPVVVMAGGKGTRLEPFTRILPKPLIPIGDKAVIEIIIDAFTAYGVDEFIISVNHKAKVIKSFFEDLAPPYRVRYIDEDQPLGTAGALRTLAGDVTGSLIVTNCDIIVRTDYADLLRTHRQEEDDVTIVASMKSYNIPYGVCELANGGRLGRIVEKPRYDLLVNTGMYVLRADVLDLIPADRVFHATDLIDAVLARGGRVGVYPISENAWLDTGEWAEYRRTVQALGTIGTHQGEPL